MKRFLAAGLAVALFSACNIQEKKTGPLNPANPAVPDTLCGEGVHELELTLADVTIARKKYLEEKEKNGPYPYNNTSGDCINIDANEGASILYVVNVNPTEEILGYSVLIDGEVFSGGWPYSTDPGNYPFAEMGFLPPIAKGNHLVRVEIISEKSIKSRSLEVLIK